MRDLISIIEALEQGCPPATQDITLNLKNRQKAIDEYHYGPLNPNEPNDEYWAELADKWKTDDIESVKENRCGNCAAFDMSEDMLDCIAKGIGSEPGSNPMDTIDAGQLGYCKFLKFKCAAKRTCDAWVEGGPITEDTATFDHLTNKKLRRILVSGPKNLDEVAWAMEFTDDALRADYDDEGIDSRTFDARNNAFNQASAAFHDEDGEFNPDADIDATLAHLKQFWSV